MTRSIFTGLAALLALAGLSAPATAQTFPTGIPYTKAGGTVILQCDAAITACTPVTSANPLVVTGPTGAASNQVQGNVADGATDAGNPVKTGGKTASTVTTYPAGQRADAFMDLNGVLRVRAAAHAITSADGLANSLGVSFDQPADTASATTARLLAIMPFYFNGTTWDRQRGDSTGAWTHAPQSTVTTAGGTIASSGGTAALAFTNTTDGEVINPSTGTLWASWGTPAVNGANSFPINAGGSYRPPSRVAGTLTLLSTAASQTYTFNKFQ